MNNFPSFQKLCVINILEEYVYIYIDGIQEEYFLEVFVNW